MKKIPGKPNEKIFGLLSLDRETLIYRVLPRFLMEILRKYFRLEVEGLENIPKKGAALVTPNHSGYSGFDVFVLTHILSKDARRVPRVLAHYFWFLSKTTAIPARKVGFTEATFENGLSALKKKNLVVIFPEGEHGNFKPSSRMYQLQEFRRGFVRMALQTQSPIIPTIIVGAEETHINLSTLKLTKFLRGLVIPLPLNVIPLPAKWRIKFLEPIHLPYRPEAADDPELVHEIAAEVQEKMQAALKKELRKRGSVYL
ncbi:MAG TPA: lysophospholipid acyltransferase family protein [Pseudobdellovibrionaceae bacterium]|nr:lysophospholipid acyltransferase family protein [Pseudobdellovibrionaceae bacterium]